MKANMGSGFMNLVIGTFPEAPAFLTRVSCRLLVGNP